MDININGQTAQMKEGTSCAEALRTILSGKSFKACIAAKADGRLLDLTARVPMGTRELSPVLLEDAEGLAILRHSAAHIMVTAVKRLFPQSKVAIGPDIASGFYYDFDPVRSFTLEDFAVIEAEMRHIVEADEPFIRREVSKQEALHFFAEQNETYKLEILHELPEESVTLYEMQDFVDLCRGPHVPRSGFLRHFKLLSVAGAYWRGSEKNKMLSRIYGTAFPTDVALKAYLDHLEEAKRRDHRKLGRELQLFDFHEDVSPGMVFWHPKGMMLRTILEDFLRREHLNRGYQLVQAPQLLRRELWERSGHYDNYRENMYFTEIDGDSYGIKPMNCLGHMLIYGSELKSYRDLPVRYAELGVVHRHEISGALHGLLRVRQFTQDDAHIICAPEQLAEEISGVISFVKDLFTLFGFSYKIAVATRPEKSIGSDEDWERATNALISALQGLNIEYVLNEGDGAFYGPKIDCRVTDSLGREWQCSTVQCDFTLPERFQLEYVAQDGARRRPVMVHRAILGSLERFIGILTEHCAGLFPVWLAPVQARVLTVASRHEEYAESICASLRQAGIRAEADTRNEKLGYKVRQAQMDKVPYSLVIGDQELEDGGVNVRLHGGASLGFRTWKEVVELIRLDSETPFKQGGMNYRFS